MRDLAEQERFEEAALARDRLRALAEALARSRIDGWLLRTDDLVLRDAGGRLRLRRGGLIRNAGDEPVGRREPRERADELSRPRLGGSEQVRVESSAEPFCGTRRAAPSSTAARDARPRRTGGARSDDGWTGRWSTRSSSRARARRSAASSVRSPSCPPSTSAYSRHGRRCVARASNPTRSTRTILGHARQAGNGPNTGRQVSVRAGVPVEVSAYNVNIACGSGMKAVQLGRSRSRSGTRGRVGRGHGEHDPGPVPARPDAHRLPDGRRAGVRRDVPRRAARPVVRAHHGRDRGEPRRPVRPVACRAGRVRARAAAEGSRKLRRARGDVRRPSPGRPRKGAA